MKTVDDLTEGNGSGDEEVSKVKEKQVNLSKPRRAARG